MLNCFACFCSMRYFDRAGLFAEACQEFGFLSPSEENNSILFTLAVCQTRFSSTDEAQVDTSATCKISSTPRLRPVYTAIFVAVIRYNFCLAKVASSFKHVRNSCDIAATNRTENCTWGAYHSTKNSGANFRKFPWANGTVFFQCGTR